MGIKSDLRDAVDNGRELVPVLSQIVGLHEELEASLIRTATVAERFDNVGTVGGPAVVQLPDEATVGEGQIVRALEKGFKRLEATITAGRRSADVFAGGGI